MSPYREASAAETLEVTTREGLLRLEVAPRHTIVRLGERIRFSVADQYATITGLSRHNRKKKRSFELEGARILVARAVPTQDVGIWYMPEPNITTRLFGARPLDLLNDQGLEALRDLDRLAIRLTDALTPYYSGVERALEVGSGANRVLIADYGERMVFYVRRLFREWPRRALEVHESGSITVVTKGRFRAIEEQKLECRSRFGVTSIGDYVRFAAPTGQDLGSVAIPWITPEERQAVVDIIARRIDKK